MVMDKHFNRGKHRRFIDSKGLATTWWKGIVCPCMNQVDGSTAPECPLCAGDGVHYYDPTTLIVLYSNLTFDRALLMTGLVDEIVLNATIADLHWVGDGDRFIPAVEQVVEQQLLRRGDLKPGGGTKERLFYRYPTELLKIIDVNGIDYLSGIDVELIDDPAGYSRNINWITAGPANGVPYSVRYRATAEFIVFLAQPRMRYEHDMKQATFCRLKRITAVRGE